MALVPLRITAHLLRGVCADTYDLDFAGLLASRVRSRNQIHGQASVLLDIDLPLGVCDLGGDEGWHWLATNPQFFLMDSRYPRETDILYRVVDAGWAGRSAQRPLKAYSHRKGAYRDVMLPTQVALTPKLEWYAVGEKAEIESLLRGVNFVGKRRGRGWGRTKKWEVEEVKDVPVWEWGHMGDTGTPMRPLPYECAERIGGEYTTITHGIRPPMWERQQTLYIPRQEELYYPEEWEL